MSRVQKPEHEIPAPFQAAAAVPDRLVHMIPDELAAKVPDHPMFAYPRTNNVADGFEEVSAARFANGINRTSLYLESTLGKAGPGFPTVGYMGTNDLRYFLFFFGAIKAGYKMLYLSPRNTVAGHLNVLEKSECHKFLSAKNFPVGHILSGREMESHEVPELEELIDPAQVPVYPYTKSFAEARKDPCLVLHTTGSTGLPKPIVWKNEILSTYEAWRLIPSVDGYVPVTEVYQESKRAYNSMPLFHTSGLNIGITLSLILGVTTVFGAAGVVPNSTYTDDIHKYGKIDASIGPPSMYEELSHEADSLERLEKLRYILVCGAPLSKSAGDVISNHTRVISNFGATETAVLQRLAPGPEDWSYFYWHPTHSGIDMRDHNDGLHELFLVKDRKLELYQGVFSTFPELEEYSMNDVYARHPDPAKPFLWKWVGRADDVIVLSNGEKLAPALMEASLMTSPLVKGAMVVGHGEFQPVAVLDLDKAPPASREERQKLIGELLPAIEESNKHAPAHGQLDPHHILFIDPERPMHYLGQGKIQRRNTYKLYEKDIRDVYNAAESSEDDSGLTDLPQVNFGDLDSIKTWLAELVRQIAALDGLKSGDYFFEAGMDSLHVIRIIREMKFQAKSGAEQLLKKNVLSTRVVYSHPTVDQLSTFLYTKAEIGPPLENGTGDDADKEAENEKSGSEYMEALLNSYVPSLPIQKAHPTIPEARRTVLLTGSTGSLGFYLLLQLIADTEVESIICLDRSANAEEKFKSTRDARGLKTPGDYKIEFYKTDLAEEQMGLGKEDYDSLLDRVTHMIHCQWPVNFNWALSSFERAITGVRNMAFFAATARHNPFLLFISSVAAVGSWHSEGQVPEAPIDDLSVASKTGYGQSKLLAEILLAKAAEISGIRTAISRVGIVAGPVDSEFGMWNKHEYIPSIMVSSAHLGVFPESFPSRDHIDWLPVDKLSKILLEVLSSASKETADQIANGTPHARAYHIVNPNTSSWSGDLAEELRAAYGDLPVRPVPFKEWLSALQASVEKAEEDGNYDLDHNPAIRLLEFYNAVASADDDKGRAGLPTHDTEEASETIRSIGPLRGAWLKTWMKQWGIRSPASLARSYLPLI